MKPLYTGSEWDLSLIDKMWKAIDKLAQTKFGLTYYTPQIEIITSEQMLDCYSTFAMPVMYNHWSFGKTFLQNERQYKKGIQGLAYEVVINTNPCIAYLMENNSATLQALVLTHAAVGHNSFFKNNYLFREWSDADTIVDYLKFARNYIKECEERYGSNRVEFLLDACHSLQAHGVDKYKKPSRLSKEIQRQRNEKWQQYAESTFNDIWRTLPEKKQEEKEEYSDVFPEENILYFIEKYSPILKSWEREIVRIVRKIAQYFYPQRQTHLMNEGWATFVHYTLMTEMHEQGLINEGSYLEFLESHTNVVTQRDWDSKYYGGFNVYALGFAIFMDIKRMCISPDKEDLELFPNICNTDWLATVKYVMENYRDESFIRQFLSPKVARKFKMFSFKSVEGSNYLQVNATHDDEDFKRVRETLADMYDLSRLIPAIEVSNAYFDSDRWLYLEHRTKNNCRLNYDDMRKTVSYINALWGFTVQMEYKDLDGILLDKVR